jgi:hypothetical protein
VYLMVESEFSATELEAALKASAQTGAASPTGIDASLNFGLTAREVLQQSEIDVLIVSPFPGDQSDLADLRAGDLDAISRLARRDVTVAPGFLGQPLSFTVAYLTDNTTTVNSVEGIFSRENCVIDFGSAHFDAQVNQLTVDRVVDTGTAPNRGEFFGRISVVSGGQRVILFDQDRNNTITWRAGVFSSDEPYWKSGRLLDINLDPNNTVTVEIDLFEKDPSGSNADDVHRKTETVEVYQLMTGQVSIPLDFSDPNDPNDGVFEGTLHLGFTLRPKGCQGNILGCFGPGGFGN